MKTKLISALVAGLALSAATITPAHAVSMYIQSGGILIGIDKLVDQGTVGYADPLQAAGTTATLCSTVALCDGPLNQFTWPAATSFGDDTWGVLSVASITAVSGTGGIDGLGTLWQRNVTPTAGMGSKLLGFFHGLQDYRVDYTAPIGSTGASITSYSTGGQVDFFWQSTDFSVGSVLASNRTSATAFTGVTDGVKAGTIAFNPTADANSPPSYYRSIYNYTSSGSNGIGYADVVSGSGSASAIDANPNTVDLASLLENASGTCAPLDPPGAGLKDPLGTCHDVIMNLGIRPTTAAITANGWNVQGTADAESYIPEPGSMALVGLGLMGLAGLRRRKQQA